MRTEADSIQVRYERRAQRTTRDWYSFLNPSSCLALQERERALLRWIRTCRIEPLACRRVLEVGCGSGVNLLEFIRFGFQPENLVGNDLMPDRLEMARRILPSAVTLLPGDAMDLDLPDDAFDVVFQSTVFTSILDADFQAALAGRMWNWTAPGGGVLWYDFIYDNPRNPDVAGVPIRRIRALFPQGKPRLWRVTLAPPIARLATRLHPALYTAVNTLPLLRTHVLCWIPKTQ